MEEVLRTAERAAAEMLAAPRRPRAVPAAEARVVLVEQPRVGRVERRWPTVLL
jgi:choline kinase